LVIKNILDSISEKLEEEIKNINEEIDKGYILELVDHEEWISYVLFKKKGSKGYIVSLTFGFESGVEYMDEKIDPNKVYFYISVDIDKEGNKFKDKNELLTYWNQEFAPMNRENYFFPRINKGDFPYAYYSIYSLLKDKIQYVFDLRKHLDYVEEALEAFSFHFKKRRINEYKKLGSDIKEWRKKVAEIK
jgi:hypothetical protein